MLKEYEGAVRCNNVIKKISIWIVKPIKKHMFTSNHLQGKRYYLLRIHGLMETRHVHSQLGDTYCITARLYLPRPTDYS